LAGSTGEWVRPALLAEVQIRGFGGELGAAAAGGGDRFVHDLEPEVVEEEPARTVEEDPEGDGPSGS
jgi:hypothetical protein